MKAKKELNALKEKEVETKSKERQKLTEEELEQVSGGRSNDGKCLCECDCCHVTTCCVDGSPCTCGGTFRSVKK